MCKNKSKVNDRIVRKLLYCGSIVERQVDCVSREGGQVVVRQSNPFYIDGYCYEDKAPVIYAGVSIENLTSTAVICRRITAWLPEGDALWVPEYESADWKKAPIRDTSIVPEDLLNYIMRPNQRLAPGHELDGYVVASTANLATWNKMASLSSARVIFCFELSSGTFEREFVLPNRIRPAPSSAPKKRKERPPLFEDCEEKTQAQSE